MRRATCACYIWAMLLWLILSCEPENPDLEACYVRCEQSYSDCSEGATFTGADCDQPFETCIASCNETYD